MWKYISSIISTIVNETDLFLVITSICTVGLVWERSVEKKMILRIVITICSVGLGVILGPEVSSSLGTPPIVTTALITATIPTIIGTINAAAGDRETLIDILKILRGKGIK